MSRKQRHKRMPQLPRHPRLPQPGRLGNHPELPPHIVIIQRRPHNRGEHQAMVLPERPCRHPVFHLPHPMHPQRLNTLPRQRQRPPRPRRLGIPASPLRPPHEHRHLLVIEPSLANRPPLPIDPRHDMIPPQRPRLLSPHPVSSDKTTYASSAVPLAAAISATACSKVSDFDGRPPSCPLGASTSEATFRPTRSSRSACRIARTSTLCAICTVRVDNRAARAESAPCTAEAVSSVSHRAQLLIQRLHDRPAVQRHGPRR
jgi:hypothetical protein